MIRGLAAFALLAGVGAAAAQTPATTAGKKELVATLLQMQRSGIEAMARSLVERPAVQMTQEAGQLARSQVPENRRTDLGKKIEARVRHYVDDATPLLRERALALAPSTLGAAMEEKFSEEELRELIRWLDSPLNKKYTQAAQEMQSQFVRKLMNDAGAQIEPKIEALNRDLRQLLAEAAAPAAPTAPAASVPKALGPRPGAASAAASR